MPMAGETALTADSEVTARAAAADLRLLRSELAAGVSVLVGRLCVQRQFSYFS